MHTAPGRRGGRTRVACIAGFGVADNVVLIECCVSCAHSLAGVPPRVGIVLLCCVPLTRTQVVRSAGGWAGQVEA